MENETEILAKLNIIEKQNEQIKKRLLLNNVFSFIRLLIIIAPIILAIIYLPPLIKNLIEEYKEISPQIKEFNLPELNNLLNKNNLR